MVESRCTSYQSNDIIVALSGVELDSKATRATCLGRKLATKRDSRESDEDGSLRQWLLQEVGLGEVGNIGRGLKVAESTRSARVHHPLEVLGAVEVLLLLKQVNIAAVYTNETLVFARPSSTTRAADECVGRDWYVMASSW